jgi:hypothetical protein
MRWRRSEWESGLHDPSTNHSLAVEVSALPSGSTARLTPCPARREAAR